jgi:hypothetical protein
MHPSVHTPTRHARAPPRLLPGGGDFASDAQLDAIVDALMAQHAPAARPTRQSVIDALPVLRVPRVVGGDAGGGIGEAKGAKESASASAGAGAADQRAAPGEQEGRGRSEGGASSSSGGSERAGGDGRSRATAGDTRADGAVDTSTGPPSSPDDDRFACCSPGEACSVCTEAFQSSERVVELPCQHCFHSPCIKPWLAEHNTCPVCRFALEVEDRCVWCSGGALVVL